PSAPPLAHPPFHTARASQIDSASFAHSPVMFRASFAARRDWRNRHRERRTIRLQTRGPSRRLEHVEQTLVGNFRTGVARVVRAGLAEIRSRHLGAGPLPIRVHDTQL